MSPKTTPHPGTEEAHAQGCLCPIIDNHYGKGRGGDVVVPVKKRSCGACYKQLEPHVVQEVKKADKVLTCDSCGRILYWAGDD